MTQVKQLTELTQLTQVTQVTQMTQVILVTQMTQLTQVTCGASDASDASDTSDMIKSAKREREQYTAILAEQALSIKELLYGEKITLKNFAFAETKAGNPELVSFAHLQLSSRVANQNTEFASSCPLAEPGSHIKITIFLNSTLFIIINGTQFQGLIIITVNRAT